MTPINKIKYKDLQTYLEGQSCFGLLASRRKHTIIYTFERYYNSKRKLTAKVKVMRTTKYVMSVKIRETVYTDYDELKAEIER